MQKGSSASCLSIKEPLIKSARADGERFWANRSLENGGILCVIPIFQTDKLGQKDPPAAAVDLFRGSLVFIPADQCTQGGKLLHDVLIAPLNKVDILHIGRSLGRQSCDHKSRAGPQIVGTDSGTVSFSTPLMMAVLPLT